jgi:hypothetical protein
VFLDPPYLDEVRTSGIYTEDNGTIAHEVRAWALEAGRDPALRIVLAGFDTEHTELERHGWRVVEWFAPGFLKGGMKNLGSDRAQHRERLWLSPSCAAARSEQQSLFGAEP